MKIVSFAWTTDALMAGRKTCTRRDWTDKYAMSFHAGDGIQCWNKLPRAHGKAMATTTLTHDPVKSQEYPEADYEAEGLAWMQEQGLLINGISPWEFYQRWRDRHPDLWVVRFNPVRPPA